MNEFDQFANMKQIYHAVLKQRKNEFIAGLEFVQQEIVVHNNFTFLASEISGQVREDSVMALKMTKQPFEIVQNLRRQKHVVVYFKIKTQFGQSIG